MLTWNFWGQGGGVHYPLHSSRDTNYGTHNIWKSLGWSLQPGSQLKNRLLLQETERLSHNYWISQMAFECWSSLFVTQNCEFPNFDLPQFLLENLEKSQKWFTVINKTKNQPTMIKPWEGEEESGFCSICRRPQPGNALGSDSTWRARGERQEMQVKTLIWH